jgi:hypothetical protein
MTGTEDSNYPILNNLTFEHRKVDMLEGEVKALKKRIDAIEKEVAAINGAKLGPVIPIKR